MNHRLWALVLAAVMFFAGIAAANLRQGAKPDSGLGIEPRAQLFESTFSLSPKRSQALRKLLEHYDLEVRKVQAGGGADVAKDLVALARQYSGLLRDKVLPPDQRGRYDRMLAEFLPTPPQR